MNTDFRAQFRNQLGALPLVGIVRNAPLASLEGLAGAVRASGLRFLEVTMNTPDACGQIRFLSQALDGFCQVGAGTVLTVAEAEQAVAAGARFLISPVLVTAVQEWANQNALPTLPGALTPQEAWNAWQAGAAMVKLFPVRSMGGPGYIKELRGPFANMPLLACGGVSHDNARQYQESGCDALAFGGSIFSVARLSAGAWTEIVDDIERLITAVRPAA